MIVPLNTAYRGLCALYQQLAGRALVRRGLQQLPPAGHVGRRNKHAVAEPVSGATHGQPQRVGLGAV